MGSRCHEHQRRRIAAWQRYLAADAESIVEPSAQGSPSFAQEFYAFLATALGLALWHSSPWW